MKGILKGAALLAVCAAALSSAVLAQRDFSGVQITSTPVAGNIHMLQGSGGNIGVTVGEDGILIVDDQFAPLADKIRAALKDLNPGKLRFILNTHFHNDHTGGNSVFGPEATIIAHTNVRQRLSTEQTRGSQTAPAAPVAAWPVITFDQSLSVYFNGEEIQMFHLPKGHTDGDSVIYFTQSNVVHMGDDFFKDRFPYVDMGSGGNAIGLAENVAAVLERIPEDAKVIPGHGDLATVDDLKRYHRMLRETIGIVRLAKQSGKTLEEAKKDGLPEKFVSWGTGFIKADQWIETIYRSLG